MSSENTFISQVIDNEAVVVVPFARVGAITTAGKVADKGQWEYPFKQDLITSDYLNSTITKLTSARVLLRAGLISCLHE